MKSEKKNYDAFSTFIKSIADQSPKCFAKSAKQEEWQFNFLSRWIMRNKRKKLIYVVMLVLIKIRAFSCFLVYHGMDFLLEILCSLLFFRKMVEKSNFKVGKNPYALKKGTRKIYWPEVIWLLTICSLINNNICAIWFTLKKRTNNIRLRPFLAFLPSSCFCV